MADYQEIRSVGQVRGYRRAADGASIFVPPAGETPSADYRVVLDWLNGGGVPDPPDPPPPIFTTTFEIDAQVRTTNATATELFRRPLQTLTAYSAELHLMGIDAGNGAVRKILANVTVKRLSGGALLVGAITTIANHADTGTTGWAITAGVSGNDFVVTVTGAATRTIDWLLSGSGRLFRPGGV